MNRYYEAKTMKSHPIKQSAGKKPMRKKLSMLSTALASALILSAFTACSILPEHQSVQLLDPQPPSPARQAGSIDWTLNVARPTSDAARDSTRVLVRTDQGQLQVHASARWVAAAPELLRTLLVRYLRDAERIDQISAGGAGMDRILALDLRRFELNERSDQRLQAEIRVEAQLFESHGNRLLARRLFASAEPVASADPVEIIRGFESALAEIIPALSDWLGEQPETPDPAG